jgi:hypothetical protein
MKVNYAAYRRASGGGESKLAQNHRALLKDTEVGSLVSYCCGLEA